MTATPREELLKRAGAYIEHNAGKEPAELRGLVQQGNTQLLSLLDGMSPAQARYKPGPDDWCVIEVLQHVATAKRGVARICARLAAGEAMAGTGREGDEQDGVMGPKTFATVAEACDAIGSAHEGLLAFIDGPLATANVDTRFRHFIFGDLNCREWTAFQRIHDGDHTNQIQQIIAAPGYPT
jgi:hypothetical protein